MLKQPLPTRARRASGVALVAAAIACGSFASWAAQPARPEGSAAVSNSPASEDVTYRRMNPPAYPPAAVVARISGNVMLKVHVDAQGNPESAIVDSLDPPAAAVLSDAAIAAVLRWKFNPALRDGVAVADDIRVPVEFRVDEDEKAGGTAQPTAASTATTMIPASYRRLSPPAYPASSVASGIEGVVYVAAAIDADGHVSSASVDHAEPVLAVVLGDAAIKAVKSWTFNPAKRDDKAIASRIVVPLRFAISDPKKVATGAMPANALEIIDVVAHPIEEDSTAKAPPPPAPPPPPPPPPPPLPPPPAPPSGNTAAS